MHRLIDRDNTAVPVCNDDLALENLAFFYFVLLELFGRSIAGCVDCVVFVLMREKCHFCFSVYTIRVVINTNSALSQLLTIGTDSQTVLNLT